MTTYVASNMCMCVCVCVCVCACTKHYIYSSKYTNMYKWITIVNPDVPCTNPYCKLYIIFYRTTQLRTTTWPIGQGFYTGILAAYYK